MVGTYTALLDSAEESTAIQLMRTFERLYFEVTGQRRFLFNRKVPTKTRWFSIFRRLVHDCGKRGLDAADYIKFCITQRQTKSLDPNVLRGSRFDQYARFQKTSKAGAVVDGVEFRSNLDRIRSAMYASIGTLNERRPLYVTYEDLLFATYRMLSPDFLATDAKFLILLNGGAIDCADTREKVGTCLHRYAENPEFFTLVKEARDAALTCLAA